MNNFSQYRCKILNDEEEIEERKVLECVVGILAKMYDMVNDNKQLNNIICSEYISDILYTGYMNALHDQSMERLTQTHITKEDLTGI